MRSGIKPVEVGGLAQDFFALGDFDYIEPGKDGLPYPNKSQGLCAQDI